MLYVDRLSFSYSDVPVLSHVSFELAAGEHLALVGRSGSGKSTLLKLLYGMFDADAGQIVYKDREILGPKFHLIPGDDRFKYVAQDFDLMPYVTVRENVGKHLSNTDKAAKNTRILELLELLELSPWADVKARDLSGGQQQRVALARALAHSPELILLDEPFSQLDAFHAERLKMQLFAYFKSKKITCITATHHGSDVLSFADKALVLENGRVVAFDPPVRLFENPPSLNVARLFGHVNEIDFSRLLTQTPSKSWFYAHELEVSDSGLNVVVTDVYFRGDGFLIRAFYGESPVYFFHTSPLHRGMSVSIRPK